MIQILAENNFFYVINKPVGFSVHNESPSVAEYLKTVKKAEHFVNRLDLETSGLMVIAQKHTVHCYAALLKTKPKHGPNH
jgi:23S rRNA-/tRNA-specific pseudouridylate synthase